MLIHASLQTPTPMLPLDSLLFFGASHPSVCRLGRQVFAAASPYLLVLYLLWFLDAYIATALDGLVTPPPVLSSIGVWGYHKPYPALVPLLLHLLTTVAIAGLARSRMTGSHPDAGSSSSSGGASTTGRATAAERAAAGLVFLPAAAVAAAGVAAGTSTAPAAAGGVQASELAVEGIQAAQRSSPRPLGGTFGSDGLSAFGSGSIVDGSGGSIGAAAVAAGVAAAGRELRQLMTFRAHRAQQDNGERGRCTMLKLSVRLPDIDPVDSLVLLRPQ